MALNMDLDLDPMGSQPALFKLYTQLAFVYPTKDSVSIPSMMSALYGGLERLSESFPWVAGQVVNANANLDAAPKYKIRPLHSTPELIMKNYVKNASVPSFLQLKDAGFPMHMLSEDAWAPCATLSSLSGSPDKSAPVMLVQLSIIQGGVVLCINLQHILAMRCVNYTYLQYMNPPNQLFVEPTHLIIDLILRMNLKACNCLLACHHPRSADPGWPVLPDGAVQMFPRD